MTTLRNATPAVLEAAAKWVARYPAPDWVTSIGHRDDDGGAFLTAVGLARPRPAPITVRWAFLNSDGEFRTTMHGEESALYEYEVMTSRDRLMYGGDDYQRSIDELMVAWSRNDPLVDLKEDRS